jgi:hypothetical protein
LDTALSKVEDQDLRSGATVEQQLSLQSELDNLLTAQKALQRELDETRSTTSSEKDLLLQQLLEAENKLRTLEDSTSSEKIRHFREPSHRLRKKSLNYSQLLAAANASVVEAREAAFAADEELDIKEQKLESIISQLSERDEELAMRSQQVAERRMSSRSKR